MVCRDHSTLSARSAGTRLIFLTHSMDLPCYSCRLQYHKSCRAILTEKLLLKYLLTENINIIELIKFLL